MPTSHTITTVYNLALDMIADHPVTGPLDDSVYARWLNRNFSHTVEAALRMQPWNFACEFRDLVADVEAPTMRWRNRYALPNGWLRVLPPTYCGNREGSVLPHAVQGNYLLTNDRLRHGVELVMNKQEPGEWDPLFADLIAARLATGMAHRFTAKNSFVDRCRQLALEALEQAELINAFEGSLPEPDEMNIIKVRNSDNWRGDREW